MILQNNSLLKNLRDPADGSSFLRVDNNQLYFAGGNSYPILNGIPILLNEKNSLFSIGEITENRSTTQSIEYRDRKYVKNYIRQRILPKLSFDSSYKKRRLDLAEKMNGGNVLVLGAGDKVDFYKELFSKSQVVISDVHRQFAPDFILDAHDIPFVDDYFSLVIADQVLEHTSRPWIVAAEIQRVTQPGGYIQIEVPFAYPYHGNLYDFYRFTPTALRFLFAECKIIDFEITEGDYSAAAVALGNSLINSSQNKYARRVLLVLSRYLFWWLKYFDDIFKKRSFNMPKGCSVTYCLDGIAREENQLMDDVKRLSVVSNGNWD